MRIHETRDAMRSACAAARKAGKSIGFVPTMGALHEGHAALIARARKENGFAAVSIFVNPAQFAPHEDLSRYPRPFDEDAALCRRLGVDALYHPSVEQVYPEGFCTYVKVEGLSSLHEGRFRPDHFRGVATVVLKLLETVGPTRAYFGEKDYQQLIVVKRMVSDLDVPVAVVPCPIVRERDGLALSSRNRYLTPEQRAAAPGLYEALRRGAAAAEAPKATVSSTARAAAAAAAAIPGAAVDYVALVDAESLAEPKKLKGRLRLLAAVRLGATRLIDNIALSC